MGQKQINEKMLRGFPGKIAIDPLRCKYHTYKCGDNRIIPGMFIQLDTATGLTLPANKHSTAGVASIAVDKVYVGVSVHQEYFDGVNNSNRIPYGQVVRVLYQGDIYMRFGTAVTPGKYIHLKKTDGSIVYDDSTSKADHIFTGARIYIGAAANEVCIVRINL